MTIKNQTKIKNKNKLSKQLEQEQNQEMEITWMVISWGGGEGEKVQRISSINGR